MAESIKVVDPNEGAGWDYHSLFDWEAAQQADIDTSNTIAVAKCRCTGGTADTTAVVIDGWTTSATDYIKIWTDPAESYRHNGTYQTGNKYRHTVSTGRGIIVGEGSVKIEGLQFEHTGTSSDQSCIYDASGLIESLVVKQNIFKGPGEGAAGTATGIKLFLSTVAAKIYIANNIFQDFPLDAITLDTYSGQEQFVFSNTFVNNFISLTLSTGTCKAINNIFAGADRAPVSGTFISGSGYNSTNYTSIGYTVTGGATGDRVSQTFTFVGASDFHLQSTDAGALGYGLNLYNDANYPFQTDIDGQDRGGAAASWDIGADEYVSAVTNLSIFASECVGSEGVFG